MRTRKITEWHDPRVKTGEVRFVAFPVQLWQNEFLITEEQEEDGSWVETNRMFIRPIAIRISDPAQLPTHLFVQISKEWLDQEKVLLSRGKRPS